MIQREEAAVRPWRDHRYFIYIMASQTRVLYIGMTNDLERRVADHKADSIPGFSSKYRTKRLVHFEETSDVHVAIEREKQLNGWTRARKVALIESANPCVGRFEPRMDRHSQEGAVRSFAALRIT